MGHVWNIFSKIHGWLKILLILVVGSIGGWYGNQFYYSERRAVIEYREGQYELINPLLECEGSEDIIARELFPFRERFEELIQKRIEENKINYAAVYFRDLNNGPWIGINEKEPFLPGSLLKIPIMIGYLKKAESDPAILNKKISYDRDLPPSGQYIRPAFRLEKGKSYTVEELIFRMIVYSDNDAAYLLRLSDVGNIYDRVYNDLNLPIPNDFLPYRISVKKYSSFFRILFNSSYLNKEMSNYALKLLNNADFHEGIVAGIPPDISVAQKFGESKDQNNQRQFHDCGIVYYPKHPYLLCIMTRGDNYNELVSVIKEISALTFNEVDKQLHHN